MMPGFLRKPQARGALDFDEGEIGQTIVDDMRALGRNWTLAGLAGYRATTSAPQVSTYWERDLLGVPRLNGTPTVMRFVDRVGQMERAPGTAPGPRDYARFATQMRELWEERYASMSDDNPIEKCTTNISVVGRNGGMAAVTNTMGARFGSKVSLPSSGVLMNNGMFWFDPEPGRGRKGSLARPDYSQPSSVSST